MRHIFWKFILLNLLAFFFTARMAGVNSSSIEDPVLIESIAVDNWVDSVFQALTPQERLGQLFMVAAYSNKSQSHVDEISRLVENENLGGLIFFQGGPMRQARLTNRYQAKAKTPLLIAMDAEWGLGMRLDSIPDFPKAMTLGAIPDTDLLYDMGKEIARQFRELGMHINFAPVVDVNSNPDNPVIGYRSFGENPQAVAASSVAYMKGMQDHGIIANAKHFPGHGDTESDSHFSLPTISHPEQQLWDVDLYPYQELIKEDLKSVMVAHLHVPSLGGESKRPTSLNKRVVTDLLQKRMNFKGLIFTDALNMKGVADLFGPGEVDLQALLAGNDVLLYSQNVSKAKTLIQAAIQDGKIEQEEVDRRIKKILTAKYEVGLHEYQPIQVEGLTARLLSPKMKELNEDLFGAAITVAANKGELIPFRQLEAKRFASLTIGGKGDSFRDGLGKYTRFDHYGLSKGSSAGDQQATLRKLAAYDVVIVGLMGISNSPSKNFGVYRSDIDFIRKLQDQNKQVVTVLFGNAYASRYLEGLDHVMITYENKSVIQRLAAQILFGGRPASGILPVTTGSQFTYGVGGFLAGLNRLSYGVPESVGLSSDVLDQIDEVVRRAIQIQATPGANVLVAKDGKVVFERSYGKLKYSASPQVNSETVYDLASITKVLATTQAVMFLHSRGELDMEKTLGDYLPELRGTNKANLKLKDVMVHEAGLRAFIPHYVKTVAEGEWKSEFYKASAAPGYSRPVSNDMYAKDALRDSIWNWTVQSELLPKRAGRNRYVYSDLTMYFMQAVVEKIVNQPLDEFLDQNFYEPLGLHTLTFNPFKKLSLENIAPTENDVAFRKRQVQGYVHDPGAAMYGGVAGHAGLFGKANDLAVMMQMMLNEGYYGDVSLLKPGTVNQFTQRQSTQSRRGWGWDKPEPEPDKGGSAGLLAPKSTFGHTGFTGTCVWADPENDLIYVFLANRVYPEAENRKLLREGIRTEIHDIIYKALQKG